MLQFTPQMRLLLSVNPTDFRKGIDALIAVCQQKLHEDPFSGAVFAFTNRERTAVKLLVYDGNGFWLCLKRFSKGKLEWWPTSRYSTYHIDATELMILLQQGNPMESNLGEAWRKLPTQPINTNHLASCSSS